METIQRIIENEKNILYKDKNFLVINKPCGLSCNLTDNDKNIFFVNRLDTPVTGCTVIALNSEYCSKLSKIFQNHQNVKKTYYAIIEGKYPKTDKILLENFISFNPKKQKAFITDVEERKSKKAKMYYECFASSDRYSFFKIELITGRTHQIRAQLSHAGFHIKGDLKYGAKRSEKNGGIRLHAYELEFLHPDTKTPLRVISTVTESDVLWKLLFNEVHNVKKK
jgi:23S rRNA pseudouridine1911/1915/1917 synthase